MNISQLAIKYYRLTIAFWVVVAILGLIALNSLQYNLFPEVTFPVVVVRAQSQLKTALETEQKVTIPIEKSLSEVSTIAEFESKTYSQQTIINLLFDTGISIKEAENSVKRTLQNISFTTPTTWEIIPFNFNESTAVSYVLKSGVGSHRYSLLELTNIAKSQINPEIKSISGVQRIDILGNQDNLIRFNGQNAIALSIIKTSQGNTLEVVKQVALVTEKLQQQLDIQLVVAETQAKYIKEATQATIDALIAAIAISVITIFAFLQNWRATLITAIAIPISLLGTFIVMAIAGFNLETLTLLALALVIGIIVDDAIVEVENIIRHLEKGESPYQAALSATEEIGFTVSVSTLTIVAVFLPIALMGGTLGQFFRPFGLTISVAVLTSLLVARTLSPVLAVYFLQPSNSQPSAPQDSQFISLYRSLLSWSLCHRQKVIAIALFISLTGVALIPLIPQGFIPSLDRGEFNILYQTSLPNIKIEKPTSSNSEDSRFSWLKKIAQSPETILLRRTLKIGTDIEEIVLDIPEVESVYTIAGFRGQPNQGKIYVKLKNNRSVKTSTVQENTRQALIAISNVKISVEDIPFVETGSDTPFKIALVGEDLKQLQQTARAIKQQIANLPTLVDVAFTGEDEDIETITRFNGERVIYLTANLTKDGAIGDLTKQVLAIAKPLIPSDIKIDTLGDSARAGKILREFGITLIIAVILMLGVLYVPFKRWLEPLAIGLSLPLAIIGSMLALLVTQSDFGMISLIGLIFLLGLLDKNGILLMDYANQLRKTGIPRSKALIQTGIIRLRPILMTTASTILGMLPIALGWGAGAELRQPMAVAIIGGLIASSLLSLIVIPVLYSLLEDCLSGKS